MDWFTSFGNALRGEAASADLIGAGSATGAEAMAHYRYQHQAKVREAVEDTFPVLRRSLGPAWDDAWKSFIEANRESRRSLDWAPETFLRFYLSTEAPLCLKELARFEHVLDVHPWSHRALPLRPDLAMGEESRVILGNHELVSFAASVTALYGGTAVDVEKEETVIIWQKEDGVYYRALRAWEVRVLENLSLGIEAALEEAPEDPEAVGEFFRWLGSSHLIQAVQPA